MRITKTYTNGVTEQIKAPMPYTEGTDVVTIQINQTGTVDYYWDFVARVFVDTATADTEGTMEYTGNSFGNSSTFISSFTPTDSNEYIITCYNETKEVSFFIDANSVGEIVPTNPTIEGDGRSTLVLFNLILEALGQPTIESFPSDWASMDEDHKEIFNYMNIWQRTVATMVMWSRLATPETITLLADTKAYAMPTNIHKPNKQSFIYNDRKLTYTEWDVRNQNRLFTPTSIDSIYKSGGNFNINKAPSASEVGEEISYIYYAIPSDLSISEPNRKTWFPNGFDYDVFAVGVLAEITKRRLQSEASTYYAMLYGDKSIGILPNGGSLGRMKSDHADSMHVNITMRNI